MQKAIASVDSGRRIRAKRASIFTAVAMAFCLLFTSPQKAEAQSITDWTQLLDALQSVGGLQGYASQIQQLQSAITTINLVYQNAQKLISMAQQFENAVKAVGDYYASFYKAQAIAYLVDTVNQLVNAAEILDLLVEINDAIEAVYIIAEQYENTIKTGQEIIQTLEKIKKDVDDYVKTVTEIYDTVNSVVEIVNAVNDFENIQTLFMDLKDNTFLKKAAKDISNKQPGNIIPSFDFDVAGLSTSLDSFVGVIDDLVCLADPSAPECVTSSPEWCAARLQTNDSCIPGHADYCSSGYHEFEDICTEGTWEFCNSGFNGGHASCL